MTVITFCVHFSGAHGVGRIDIVENRFVGMKSRGRMNSGPTPSSSSMFQNSKEGIIGCYLPLVA